jgi:serine/threonine protein kinase/Tfp pilus assembly protein PilF
MIGQILSHYKIIEKVGEGGMGIVYKAQDTKLDRIVALKLLPPRISSDQAERDRFQHEAKAAAALTHQNIAVLYEVGESEGQLFLSLEYVEGITLKTLLGKGTLKVAEVLEIAVQICEGLSAAHAKGIVHRDIKSDNIMVTPKGHVKIMDFGLAKLKGASKLTKTGSTLGTAAYMSPEQAQGEDVDQRSDLFSLGVVFYELLTGRLPFRGEHHAALLYALINEEQQPLARYNEGVSDELQRIVSKCLSKSRDERYQHAEDLLADIRHERKRLEYAQRPQPATSKSAIPVSGIRKPTWRIAAVGGTLLTVLLATLLVLLQPWGPSTEEASHPDARSIAVLPFTNMSDDIDDEYFSDGITEDILTQLVKIRDLKVVSRTTIMNYKGTTKSLHEIAQELGVGSILEGSVRRSGSRVRIVSQLIDARTDEHVWAETYDRELSDIFAIQSDVATRIASALQATLSLSEQAALEKPPTSNTDAYSLYLRGRYYWRKRSRDGLRAAARAFEEATKRDPGYALAYVGLADTYALFPYYGVQDLSVEEAYDRAEQMARRALEINPNLAEAHTALGNILKEARWDWVGAETAFRNAIDLDPRYATAHHWYSEALATVGRFDEAERHARVAVDLEPASAIIQNNLGHILTSRRNYDEAERVLSLSVELDPSLRAPRNNLLELYSLRGNADAWRREARNLNVDETVIGIMEKAFSSPERSEEALTEFRRFVQQLPAQVLRDERVIVASTFALLGGKEESLAHLQQAARERHPELPYAIRRPAFIGVSGDRRFQTVLELMNLEQ